MIRAPRRVGGSGRTPFFEKGFPLTFLSSPGHSGVYRVQKQCKEAWSGAVSSGSALAGDREGGAEPLPHSQFCGNLFISIFLVLFSVIFKYIIFPAMYPPQTQRAPYETPVIACACMRVYIPKKRKPIPLGFVFVSLLRVFCSSSEMGQLRQNGLNQIHYSSIPWYSIPFFRFILRLGLGVQMLEGIFSTSEC